MKELICALLSAAVIFSLVACAFGGLKKYTEYSYEYFDTVTQISGYAKSRREFDEVCGFILSELAEYHRLYDIYFSYDKMNNLRDLNALTDGKHQKLTVDEKIISLLKYAKEMYNLTDGYMNVAMGGVLSVWHDYREAGLADPESAVLPPREILAAAAGHTDIGCIEIDGDEGTVFISDPLTSLDVGALAKGYAVERIAQSLYERGITGYLLSVGGNVRAVGCRGDGEKWLCGIENPIESSDEPYIGKVKLSDCSLVTSGSYQRFYTVDGKQYNHIINPETLMPSEKFISVTILAESSALSDALSTALFNMDLKAGETLISSLEGVEAMWVLTDDSTVRSEGFGTAE